MAQHGQDEIEMLQVLSQICLKCLPDIFKLSLPHLSGSCRILAYLSGFCRILAHFGRFRINQVTQVMFFDKKMFKRVSPSVHPKISLRIVNRIQRGPWSPRSARDAIDSENLGSS